MKRVYYHLADPTGNMTVLCLGDHSVTEGRKLAGRLMDVEPAAEQAGFVYGTDDADIGLEMSGGEFCGNAAMSAAALYCRRHGYDSGAVRVKVSGAEAPVKVYIQADGAGGYKGRVAMPGVLSVGTENIGLKDETFSLPVVKMAGICHAVWEQPMEKEKAERLVKEICRKLSSPAAGLMLLDISGEKLTPLVYVSGVDTLFWESSCASGTAAVGAYLAAKRRTAVRESFTQPGGCLEVEADLNGKLTLSGRVILSDKKEAVF